MMCTMRCQDMLLMPYIIIFIHQLKAMKHSNINGYLSLQHISPCPLLKGLQRPVTTVYHTRLFFANCIIVWTMIISYMLSEAPQIILLHPRKVMKHSSSNVCLLLEQTSPFPVLEGCPNLIFCM